VEIRNGIRRALLLQHRDLAARNVADDDEQISQQQAVIADLGRAGIDTSLAESFLKELRAAKRVHVASRDRIERELDTSPTLPH